MNHPLPIGARVPDTACEDCGDPGCTGWCDEVGGRWIEAVAEYASTCDWCGELALHDEMEMDERTQLGYCPDCQCLPEVRVILVSPFPAESLNPLSPDYAP